MSEPLDRPGLFYRLLCLPFLLTITARAEPTLSVGNTFGVPGSTGIVPNVFTSDTNIVALQYDLIFEPARLTAGPATGGDALANHLLGSSSPGPGIRRVLVYSLSNARLTNGVLADLVFSIATNAPTGTTSITLTNAIFANEQGERVEAVRLISGTLVVAVAIPAHLGAIVVSTNGQARFQITGTENRRYLIQASTNLVQWTDLSTIAAAPGAVEFTDSTATNFSFRFYRAVLAP